MRVRDNAPAGKAGDRSQTAGDVYMCIDLKSFFASVECVERGLDPMTTRLVVADEERGRGTICLAVTPAMKVLGVKNRCRVYEIPQHIDYIKAPPRMQKYIDYSARIYGLYLDLICADDIHVYSIDEVYIYASPYMKLYGMSARELAAHLMKRIRRETGICATCGIGTNMYLCKIALDIEAKHALDFIGELDEERYRRTLWEHRPLTDFWRVGRGTVERLARYGIFTMKDIAHADVELLYRVFGIDAELLIDHAWGRESTRMEDIKGYRTRSRSLSAGQVLMRDYDKREGRVIVSEMTQKLTLDLLSQSLVCSSVGLYVGYADGTSSSVGRRLARATDSGGELVGTFLRLYDGVVSEGAEVRRINITFGDVGADDGVQYSLFDDVESKEQERRLQMTMIDIKRRYGLNAILKGTSFDDASTARERNMQIGGHKSGTSGKSPDAES